MFKIKPYAYRLIKQNVVYVAAVVLLLILIVLVVKIGLDRVKQTDKENKVLVLEVKELQTKFDLLNSVAPGSSELDQYIKLLNGLIPDAEDYFSIIQSLELLSQKTGFVVISYTVGVNTKLKDRFKLSITGIGDTNSFLSFLENYNYGGGRLITSDKIELNPQLDTAIKINLTFYNKKIVQDLAQDLQINADTISEIAALIPKVGVSFKEEEEGAPDFAYPKKSNPF
ncbi:hypothetical protein A2970_02460 [Candidatus Roizmanbacteria bacterium RIFCSPLOWO2_01_FULL_44_13]|uniref:Uncharacterized protein n=1 Tax=Candidatus Roizmanbacteria bacterium RIFCSPLOWO2_01_FULL_44_13 TaxID=1802069 RepID=A0A1F7JCN9_9BACT|nr:MAG: hypothetical protein A2970_02460 [Candidatus Roizmanbacteria bacterium RIFCSPLOWO2_01_FULL_44_13]